jgi:mandelate racemase
MPPNTDFPVLTVRAISAVGVEVPMRFTLGTSRGRITKAPLLLIDVETAEGITGRAYLWSYFPRAMTAIASLLQETRSRWPRACRWCGCLAASRGESRPTIPAGSD